MASTPANQYELRDQVRGSVTTSGFGGQPVISLRVGADEARDAELTQTAFGVQVTALLNAAPDRDTTRLLLILPQVNVVDKPVEVTGVAVLVTSRTSIGGPALVSGAIESYAVLPVSAVASVVET